MSLHFGTGSWADDAYARSIYPAGTPAKDRLRAYARIFNHVEVNSSYYATPREAVVRGWLEQTPGSFTFSIKLHRAFSQSPEKATAGELLDRLQAGVAPLLSSGRLTAFLLVLPPSFGPLRHRLEELDTLAAKLAPTPLAVELRDRAWVAAGQRASTLDYFRTRGLVWVAVDMPKIADSKIMPAIDEVTHPKQAYLRLHGRNPAYLEAKTAAEGHHYAYSAKEITALGARIQKLARAASDVFVIANNHAEDFAPKTAMTLLSRFAKSNTMANRRPV